MKRFLQKPGALPFLFSGSLRNIVTQAPLISVLRYRSNLFSIDSTRVDIKLLSSRPECSAGFVYLSDNSAFEDMFSMSLAIVFLPSGSFQNHLDSAAFLKWWLGV